MVNVLLVHSPSAATAQIAGRPSDSMPELGDIDVTIRPALEASVEDVLAADAYVLDDCELRLYLRRSQALLRHHV